MRGDRIRLMMVIDQLGSGGAERQFCMLSKRLKERGFDVRVAVFQPNDFSAYVLHESGIPITTLAPRNGAHLVSLMRSLLRRSGTQVVVAFLKWSSLVVELAGFLGRRFAVIVSERSLEVDRQHIERMVRYRMHFLADAVVCNSFAQRDQLVQAVPRIDARTSVIVNGVDLEYFRFRAMRPRDGLVRILVLARYAEQKNPFGLLEGVTEFHTRFPSWRVEVDWYGHLPGPQVQRKGRLTAHYRSELAAASIHARLSTAVRERGLEGRFRLHRAAKDVVALYGRCDVVCVPSFYEGCSNVVGEALACGRPVIASDVSDNGRLVREGVTGFLFDPGDPTSIARAMDRCVRTPSEELAAMASAGRRAVQEMLAPDVLGDRFADLIVRVLNARVGVS